MSMLQTGGYGKGTADDRSSRSPPSAAGRMTRRTCSTPPRSCSPARASTGRRSTRSRTTAGFTKGAVYSNFKSKDDLFLALLDDRIERQFSVVEEVLDGTAGTCGRHGTAVDASSCRASASCSAPARSSPTTSWDTLYLEFVLYARRNPEAAAKLAARAEQEREFVQQLIEDEHAIAGVEPKYPTARPRRDLARALQRAGHDAPERSRSHEQHDPRHRARRAHRRDGVERNVNDS